MGSHRQRESLSMKPLAPFTAFTLLSLSFVSLPLCYSQTVYTWVDDEGVRHFSDSPGHERASALTLPDVDSPPPQPEFDAAEPVPSTDHSNAQADTRSQEATRPASEHTASPLQVTIISPSDDQAVRSNSGRLTIQGEANRKLAIGEQFQLLMNGQPFDAPTHRPNWSLTNVDRGSHSFIIQAFRDGKLIASSNPITVHLQRVSTAAAPSAP